LAEVHVGRLDELSPQALLGILAVRQNVFIVEQDCVYADIDRRDMDASTLHLWIDARGEVVSTLRLLDDGVDGRRIGRVATLPTARGNGYSSALVERAIALSAPPIVLSAQAYLVDWYGRFGFEVCGEHWIEDGIDHAPMRLEVRR
jgi:ElaA protein